MKSNYILFAITCLPIFFICQSMDQHQLNPMKGAVIKAFTDFDINPDCYSVVEGDHEVTPKEGVLRWYRENKQIFFTRDICSNPDLTEFVAYCTAADVKNSGYLKSQLARWGTSAGSIATPLITASVTSNSSGHCLLFLASCLPVLALAIDFLNINNKIFNSFDNQLATSAFTSACQKLIETKNYKPIAAYYAYAKTIRHMPVGQESQLAILEDLLWHDSKKINVITIREKREAQILDERNCNREGRLALCAVATYP